MAVNIVDPDNTRRFFAVGGRVIATTSDGAAESIDEISHKYLGIPYPRQQTSGRVPPPNRQASGIRPRRPMTMKPR